MAETRWLETLIREQAQINQLIDLFPDAIVLVREDLRIIGANQSAMRLLDLPLVAFKQGTPVKEFLTRLARQGDFTAPEVKQAMQNALSALAKPEKSRFFGAFPGQSARCDLVGSPRTGGLRRADVPGNLRSVKCAFSRPFAQMPVGCGDFGSRNL